VSILNIKCLAVVLCFSVMVGCTTAGTNQISAPVNYVTTPPQAVTAMLKLANLTADDVLYDLGSGDGRIVIAAAGEFGAHAVGVEIEPTLVEESERNAEEAGVGSRVRFVQQDLFKVNISEANVVTVFLLPGINVMLAPKFLEELRPGARVVSYRHDMGEWRPDKTIRIDGSPIYCWVIPADAAGAWTLQIPTAESLNPLALSFRQTYQQLSGSARLHDKRISLQDPRISGDALSFAISGTVEKMPVLMEFSGRVQNGTATGTVVVKGGTFSGTHQWSAKRTAK